ncbi:MAG: hypothetical protein GXP62_22175, partial [Oligoflexia bacterium]|nr:hypothetical protein [Oligoflexia bacterium]
QLFLGGELSTVVTAAVWVGGRWYPAQVDEASRTVTLAADAQAEVDAWVQDGSDDLVIRAELEGARREREWRAARVWVPETERRAQAVAAAQASREWCVPQARPATIQRTFLVCMDTETGDLRTRRSNERGATIDQDNRALSTGTYIEVAVRHPAYTDVRITLQDARGGSQGQAPAVSPAQPGPVETEVTHRLFAPREAGTVEVRTESGAAPVTVTTLDVVDRYLAAFRLGMAVTTPAHQAWKAGTPDASGLAPIIASDGDIVDGELVVSVAPFLQRGGRDYLVPQPFRLAPQFGLGVVAVNGASIRFSLLQSYYLGAELELTSTFAVSLSGSLRRVGRLASGVQAGDLIDPSTSIPTIHRFHPGIAVAVGFTPRGLRLKAPAR